MSDIVHVIRATIDPSTAPTREGQHWINSTTKQTWLSVGTSTVADWILMGDSDKVKASGVDTTAGFLSSKITAGSGIALTTINPGANEVISISAPGSTTDEKVKVSATDTTAGYLNSEVTISNGVNVTSPLEKSITSPGADEKLNIQFDQTKISITSSQVSNFTEASQDAIGASLLDTATIDLTYNDTANQISADLKNTTVAPAAYGSATQVPTYTVDAQGRLTAAANIGIAIPSTAITDFTEAVQDAMGGALVDSASVDFVYNDLLNTQTANVLPGGVNHDALQNWVANKHIDHSSVSLIAGTGISPTGLGDITASRTINLSNTAVTAASYGSATAIPTFTVNAQGQLTAAATSTTLTPAAIGAQPADGDLTGISSLAGTGVVVRTAADTYTTRTITAGTGIGVLNGDGVSGNPTVSLSNVGTAGTYGSATQTPVFTTNAQGQVTSVANTAIALPSTSITDFIEAAQDSVGGILTDTTSVDFTYNDLGNTISAVVLPAGVNHDALQNWVANKHIDHSTVSISAGAGLSGGGDITASRTISMPNVGTAGTYGNTTNFPIITVDAQGRVTSVTTTPADSIWIDAGGLLTWSDETGKDLVIRQAGASGSAYIRQVSSNGTLAAPTASTIGQRLGGNGYYGWNSTGQNGLPSTAFNGYATENHTSTAQGGELRVELIPNGGTTPIVTSTFYNNGDWGVIGAIEIGNTTDTADGHIRYTGTEFQGRQAGAWIPFGQAPTYIQATGAVTTTSATFATVGGMTATPAAGTYKLDFTCAAALSASNSTGDFGVFIAGVEQAQCRRTIGNGAAAAVASSVAISTMVTVNGSQTITIQFRENASATLTVNARELILTPTSR